tara:strand:- start:37 stop:1302 length:1266 start_codon:yes stop_codon:yes gene_type:complete
MEKSMSITPNKSDNREKTIKSELAQSVFKEKNSLVEFFSDLLKIKTQNPPGDCMLGAKRVEEEFTKIGLDTEFINIEKANKTTIPIVLGWLGPRTNEPDLLLNSHIDAPPEGDGWTKDPYKAHQEFGNIYGRGAALGKSDVAAYTYAGAVTKNFFSSKTNGSVLLAITADEGSGGGNGPAYLLEKMNLRPKRVICPGFTKAVITEQCGCVLSKIRISGLACHQAFIKTNQEAMRVAVAISNLLLDLDNNLRQIKSKSHENLTPRLNITRFQGGNYFGMAPGDIEIWLDRRTLPDESTDKAISELEKLIKTFKNNQEVKIDFEIVRVAQPLCATKSQLEWAKIIKKEAAIVLGSEIPILGLPIYTDARWFGSYKIPTVGYGPGNIDIIAAGINGKDENISETELIKSTEIISRVIASVVLDS